MIIAIPISMAIIPLLAKWASVLGMVDRPDPRKVHSKPIPRVGGLGIVIGALVPIAIWLNWNDLIIAYLLGSLVLLVFGIWDDIKQLGHYVKFIGQFTAVLLVIYVGGLYVTHLPLIGEISEEAGKAFTVIAMIGVINALNHSDGLDGLAGGESLLSLGAIAYLSYQINDMPIVIISLATIGGIFGFLRFNSHPARVFMGDGGSQFLGFTLAFLVVHLTQISNIALSPAVSILLIGLPVVDILAVLTQRIYGGFNWFRESKNHIHHRLLEIGFHHYESVMVIYSVQAILVLCAVFLRYESDILLLSIYILISALLFGFLLFARHSGWQAHKNRKTTVLDRFMHSFQADSMIMKYNKLFIHILLSIYLLYSTLSANKITQDLYIDAGILFVLLLARLIFSHKLWFINLRLIIYVTIAFSAYILNFILSINISSSPLFYIFYILLAISVMISIRNSGDDRFEFNPLDYLLLLIIAIFALVSEHDQANFSNIFIVIQLVILFYAAEITIKHMGSRINTLTISSLAALGIIITKFLL